MAGEIASAYISLLPKLDGKALKGEAGRAGDEAGAAVGKKTGGALSGALKTALKVAPFAAMGLSIGTALTKGFSRLTSIENATAKLTGLGNSASSVKSIMDNALASVRGTAFGLDEAATTAAGAVAAGIKPGKELEHVLKTVADTATIAGKSMADTGAIFGSVAARGKLQGDDLMQLQSAGVPVLAMLAKHYKITAAEASKMVSKGEVDFKNFNAALSENLGGAALKSGETTQGAFKNMGAAVSRFGQTLLKGVFPLAKEVFGGITSLLDKAGAAMEPFVTAVSSKIVTGFHNIKENLIQIHGILAKGAFSALGTWDEDSKIVDRLFKVREAFIGLRDLWRSGLTGGLGSVFKVDEASLLRLRNTVKGALEDIRTRSDQVMRSTAERIGVPLAAGDTWRDLAVVIGARAFDAVKKFGAQVWTVFKPQVMETFRLTVDAVRGSFAALKPYVRDVFGKLKDTWDQLLPILPQLLGALNPMGSLLKGLLPVLPVLAEAFGRIAQSLADALLPIIPPLNQAFTVLVNAGLKAAVTAIVPLVQWSAELLKILAPLAPVVVGVWAGFKGVEAAKTAVGGIRDKISDFKDMVGGVKERIAGFRDGLDTIRLKGMYAKDAVQNLITKMGGLKSALATVGFAAATVGVLALGAAIAKWNDDTQAQILLGGKLKDVTRDWTNALVASNGAIDDNVRLSVAKQIQDSGLADKAAKAGISLRQLTDAVTGGKQATYELIASWQASGKPSDETVAALLKLSQGYQDSSQKASQLRGAQDGTTSSLSTATQAMNQQVTASDALRNALDQLSGKAINTEQAALNLQQGINSLKDQVNAAAAANEDGARTLDMATQAGLRNRQAVLSLIQQTNAHVQAMADQGASAKEVEAALNADAAAIKRAAEEAHLNAGQTQRMIDKYMAVPSDIKTRMELDVSGALAGFRVLEGEWSATLGRLSGSQRIAAQAFQTTGHNAGGTDDWRGGLTWVGERGPEIVALPPHSAVINNRNADKLGGMSDAQFDALLRALGRIEARTAGVGSDVGGVLQGVAGSASVASRGQRGYY